MIALTSAELAAIRKEAAAEELEAQADAVARRIQYHGLGTHARYGRYGVCPRCEAWRLVMADLRRRAAAIREQAA